MTRWLIIATLLGLIACSENGTTDNDILVRIGENVITGDEFIHRAVYTVRPQWCSKDNPVHKKIVLNSLIAEKLLALEDQADSTIDMNPDIQAYLKGRREQELRQLHFQRIARDKVELDPESLKIALENSERTYHAELIPVGDDEIAGLIRADLKAGKNSFAEIKDQIESSGGKVQKLDLKFDSPLDDAVYKALFHNTDIQKGQVLGPIHLDRNANTLIRINGWTRRPIISDTDARQRLNDIREKETEVAAMDIYVDWVQNKMSGKKIEFNREVLKKLVETVGPLYFDSREKSKELKQKDFWGLNSEQRQLVKDITRDIDAIADLPLLTVDGQTWTVSRFEQEIKVHPLVFRNPKMSKQQFGQQFRLAIADLIRDKYIVKDAYERGFDGEAKLERRYRMWEDNIRAEHRKEMILRDAGYEKKEPQTQVTEILDPYVTGLLKKYSHKIEINTELFEKIALPEIDVIVLQENVPFPVYVPNFPQLTTHDKLDYGSKLEVVP